MARVISVPPFPGAKELFALLDLINNHEMYKAYLQKLEDARNEINAMVELVGKAEEIPSLQAKAEAALLEAEGELKKAKDESMVMIKDARQIKLEAEDFDKSTRDAAEARLSEVEAHLAGVYKTIETREHETKVALKNAQELETQAIAKLERAQALEAEYGEKIARLRAAGVL